MALTKEEILQAREQFGITPMESVLPVPKPKNAEARKRRFGIVADKAMENQEKQGLFSRIGTQLKERGGKVKEILGRGFKQSPISTAVQLGGQLVGSAGDVAFEGARSVFRAATKEEDVNVLGSEIQRFFQTETGQKAATALEIGSDAWGEFKKDHPTAAANVEGVANLIGAAPFAKPAVKGVKSVKEVAEAGAKEARRVVTNKLVNRTKKPVAVKAVGQVIQGKTKDIEKGVKALSQLETKGVKTFKDLDTKINTKISELAKQVDSDLSVDPTKVLLADLVTEATTKAGTTVRTNPVEDALTQLKELYSKTGAAVKEAEIDEVIEAATKQGLDNLEVNDIARVYGSEFGRKAFSKLGDPLTSVNAQRFENTRKAVKKVARKGIRGADAKVADEAMSNLFDTRILIQKNVEAVNKIRQKISERGLLEKVGHIVAKTTDVLTGGAIRGVVGGILPRGVGFKVMNALDLEEALKKNLKIIRKAIESEKDADIVKILKGLEKQDFKKAVVPKTADSTLTKEAKKYKSAEEFVKAQGTTVYHGSPKASVIEKEGFSLRDLGKGSGYKGTYGAGATFATDITRARLYGDVVEVKIPSNLNLFKTKDPVTDLFANPKIPDKSPEALSKTLKEMGYDGVQVGDEIVVFDPSVPKTKSQLTDIWKKANKK